MPAGYEEQLPSPAAGAQSPVTPEMEARFQNFINQGGSPGSNLRDAFAQLLNQSQNPRSGAMSDMDMKMIQGLLQQGQQSQGLPMPGDAPKAPDGPPMAPQMPPQQQAPSQFMIPPTGRRSI